MEIRRWGNDIVISLGLHGVILFLLLKANPKIEVKIQKENVLQTYIVSYKEQEKLLKKDEILKEKIQDKTEKEIVQNNNLKPEKAIKNKSPQVINKEKPNQIMNQKAEESKSNKVKTFKKLNTYSGLNNIISQEHTRFIDSKSRMSNKPQIGRIAVPKAHQKNIKSEELVRSSRGDIFKQDGKCYVEIFGSQMSKLGMPSGTVPCPGEKSTNETAYAAAMNKWLNKH